MPSANGTPTGRAGRLWLLHRIAVAQSGADQLERKTRILAAEIAQRRAAADVRRAEWCTRCDEADAWLVRAALVRGHDATKSAWIEAVDVNISWTSTMGVRHPASANVGEPGDCDTTTPGVAAHYAKLAFDAAVRAALDLAVADATVAALDRELVINRRRARILQHHWVPRLRARLRDLELALAQTEQEDQSRLRRLGADFRFGGVPRESAGADEG